MRTLHKTRCKTLDNVIVLAPRSVLHNIGASTGDFGLSIFITLNYLMEFLLIKMPEEKNIMSCVCTILTSKKVGHMMHCG